MARFGDTQLAAMISKFGVPVSHIHLGISYDTWGIVDESDIEQTQSAYGALSGRIFEVLIKTGSLPYVSEGDALEVDGTDYTVVKTQRLDDGLVMRVLCTLD